MAGTMTTHSFLFAIGGLFKIWRDQVMRVLEWILSGDLCSKGSRYCRGGNTERQEG